MKTEVSWSTNIFSRTFNSFQRFMENVWKEYKNNNYIIVFFRKFKFIRYYRKKVSFKKNIGKTWTPYYSCWKFDQKKKQKQFHISCKWAKDYFTSIFHQTLVSVSYSFHSVRHFIQYSFVLMTKFDYKLSAEGDYKSIFREKLDTTQKNNNCMLFLISFIYLMAYKPSWVS